jgi:hypothetical protein
LLEHANNGDEKVDTDPAEDARDWLLEWVCKEIAVRECELLDEDVKILRILAELPKVAMYQEDIAAAANLHRKSVGARLEYLRKQNLVKHPEGRTKRGGTLQISRVTRLTSKTVDA